MKFTIPFISLLALPFATLAAPTDTAAVAIEERAKHPAGIEQAYTICSNLYSEIRPYTGNINSTASSISKKSSASKKSAAATSVGKQLHHITKAVRSATKQIKAINTSSSAKRDVEDVEERQAAAPSAKQLALLVEQILLEISGALNNIIADLGLQPLLSFLTPLVGSLSGLLLSLEAVVNNLLALVKQLVDGLLNGLSIGLAGLIL